MTQITTCRVDVEAVAFDLNMAALNMCAGRFSTLSVTVEHCDCGSKLLQGCGIIHFTNTDGILLEICRALQRYAVEI